MSAISLTVTSRSGALVRVLGLTERRGFTPVRMDVDSREDGDYQLNLSVRSHRPVELLVRQLSKLLEVKQVEVLR